MDLALNNLQWLICHKRKGNEAKQKLLLDYPTYFQTTMLHPKSMPAFVLDVLASCSHGIRVVILAI